MYHLSTRQIRVYACMCIFQIAAPCIHSTFTCQHGDSYIFPTFIVYRGPKITTVWPPNLVENR